MESSDSLVEEASKLRNRMCNGPVVADDGLVWRVTMWGGESCGQELRKGPSEDGTCKQDLDGRRNLEAGALIEGRARLEPQAGLSLACVRPQDQYGRGAIDCRGGGGHPVGWRLLVLILTEKLAGVQSYFFFFNNSEELKAKMRPPRGQFQHQHFPALSGTRITWTEC